MLKRPGTVKAYDRVIEINPRYSLAWNNKGNALKVQGKYDEAVKAYDEVIKLEPQDVKAWLYKGDALFQVKKYDEAIKSFDEVIKLKPQDANPQNISILAQTWYNKSEALKLLGHTKEADSALAMARNLGFSESVIRKISHKLHNILEGP